MQYGTKREEVLDILENVIAVLRGLRERQGIKVNDVLVNLETAHLLVSGLQDDRTMDERHPIDRKAAGRGFTE